MPEGTILYLTVVLMVATVPAAAYAELWFRRRSQRRVDVDREADAVGGLVERRDFGPHWQPPLPPVGEWDDSITGEMRPVIFDHEVEGVA